MRWTRSPVAILITSGLVVIAFGGALPQAIQPSGPRALDTSGPVTYFIAEGSAETGFRPPDRQLALWALQAWERSGGGALSFAPAPESAALVRLYWAEANAGQYGEMRSLTVGGRRGAAVYIRPDMESLGPDIARRSRTDLLLRDSIVYLTCLHELGHALGLAHTSEERDIMYFFGYGGSITEYFGRYRAQLRSRDDIVGVSGLSDDDVRRLRGIYPGR